MTLFRKSSGNDTPPLEPANGLFVEDIRKQTASNRVRRASEAGVLRTRDAQIAESEAINQVSKEHERLMHVGDAAEEAGKAAMHASGVHQQPIDVNHQLRP